MSASCVPCVRRTARIAFASCAAFCAGYAHADLVFHQGFESCWTPSDTPAQFLSRLHDSVDGLEGCIPPTSGSQSGVDYSICNTPACQFGVAGCPVHLHAGAATGDFASGAFAVPGSGDDIAIPVTYTLLGQTNHCTLTVSGVVLGAALGYEMLADGENGIYTDALTAVDVTIDDYTLAGCDALAPLIGVVAPTLIGDAQAQAAAVIEPVLQQDTVDVAICPSSP